LPKRQKALFEKLSTAEWITSYYLAGGTALALQIGHRQSIDFDFFSETEFDLPLLIRNLEQHGSLTRLGEAKGTLHCAVSGVKLSFFHYPQPVWHCQKYGLMKLASILDIALMKLEAIAGRGDKKDFIDLYFILRRYSLQELLQKHVEKYGPDWSNRYHLLKSLIYFTDAEEQPMPVMLEDIMWKHVKELITQTVLQIDPTGR
jgi:hypothetical protein